MSVLYRNEEAEAIARQCTLIKHIYKIQLIKTLNVHYSNICGLLLHIFYNMFIEFK